MRARLAVCLALAGVSAACGGGPEGPAGGRRGTRDVVAVTTGAAAWVAELAGAGATLQEVAPAGADPGAWRPDEAALEALVTARQVLLTSEEVEPWTQRAGLPPSRTVTLVDLVDPGALLHTAGVEHTHGTGPAHSHGGTVGTVWTDPELVATLPRAAAEALGLDPKGARAPEGLAEYRAALEVLRAAAGGRAVVATDHGLEYVARAAGFEVRVALLECDDEGPTNQRGILQLEAFAGKDDDAGLLVWVGPPPHGGFAAIAEKEFGARSLHFDLGLAPGSDLPGALTASVLRLAEALQP